MKPNLLVLALLSILSVLAADIASAATVYGTIYDFELNKAGNSIVEISTLPKQTFVAKNGTYSFEVPFGNYTISAKSGENTAEEQVMIVKEGDYLLDLILFPDLSEEEDIIAETELTVTDEYFEEKSYLIYYYIAGLAILFCSVLAAIFFYKRKIERHIKEEIKEVKKEKEIKEAGKEFSTELKELLEFVKKENGRTTQKDIRKNFPQSEAKISLMITELEAMGKIKKIKKGRGNIIILK